MSRKPLLVAAVAAALVSGAVACGGEEVPPVQDGGGGSSGGGGNGGGGAAGGGGSGGTGGQAGGGGTGGQAGGGGAGGTGGGGGAGDGCDDAADACNGGVCPVATVDCETAAANWAAQCEDPACGLSGGQPCPPSADILAGCLEESRASPTSNATWACQATVTQCGDPLYQCVSQFCGAP